MREDSDEASDELYLVHYQLIHQVSRLPAIVVATGVNHPEYFYHKFVLFDPRTNSIHVIAKGIDDVSERAEILEYLQSNREALEFDFGERPDAKTDVIGKYYRLLVRMSTECGARGQKLQF